MDRRRVKNKFRLENNGIEQTIVFFGLIRAMECMKRKRKVFSNTRVKLFKVNLTQLISFDWWKKVYACIPPSSAINQTHKLITKYWTQSVYFDRYAVMMVGCVTCNRSPLAEGIKNTSLEYQNSKPFSYLCAYECALWVDRCCWKRYHNEDNENVWVSACEDVNRRGSDSDDLRKSGRRTMVCLPWTARKVTVPMEGWNWFRVEEDF